MSEPISFVKAVQDFFSKDPNGRKVTIDELKALSPEDRKQLRDMLIKEGYNVTELQVVKKTE